MNVWSFLLGRWLAESAGAPPDQAARIAVVTAFIRPPMSYVVATRLGQAATPPPQLHKTSSSQGP